MLVAVKVCSMTGWSPAQAKHLAQLAEPCLHTRAYCQALDRMRLLVLIALCLESRYIVWQGRSILAQPSSPVCCIKC
jgi:hypothetical protein